jgi:hypothetical protein
LTLTALLLLLLFCLAIAPTPPASVHLPHKVTLAEEPGEDQNLIEERSRKTTKDHVHENVCENFKRITGRTSGFDPVVVRPEDDKRSTVLNCGIQPNYPCFPETETDYIKLKRYYEVRSHIT